METVLDRRRARRSRTAAVNLDVTLLTTDPAPPRPAIVLAHGFGGTKADSAADRPHPGPRRLRRAHLHRARLRRVRRADPPRRPGVRGRATPSRWSTCGRTGPRCRAGDDPVLGFAGALVRRRGRAAGRRRSTPGSTPSSRVHLAQPDQALFPQYARAAGPRVARPTSPRPARTGVFKAALGGAVLHAARPRPDAGAGGRRRRRRRACADGSPRTSAGPTSPRRETGRARPRRCSRCCTSAPRRVLRPDHRADADDPGRGRHAVPASTRPTPPARPAGRHARRRWPGCPAGTTAGHRRRRASWPARRAWFDRYLKRDGAARRPGLLGDGARDLARRPTATTGRPRPRRPPTLPGPGRGRRRPARSPLDRRRADRGHPGRRHARRPHQPARHRRRARRGGRPRPATRSGCCPARPPTFTTAPLTAPADLVGSGRVELAVSSSPTEATLFASRLGPRSRRHARPGPAAAPTLGRPARPRRRAGPADRADPGPSRRPSRSRCRPVAHQVPVGHRLQAGGRQHRPARTPARRPRRYRVALSRPALVAARPRGAAAGGGSRLDVPLPLRRRGPVLAAGRASALVAARGAGARRGRPRAGPGRRPAGRRRAGQDVRRRLPRGRRRLVPGRARPGGRPARTERRGQDDDHADAGRA